MAWTAVQMETPLIPNTTMCECYNDDGVHKTYEIRANDGYVLHDTNYDSPEVDENYEETGDTILGYIINVVSCPADYAFTPTQMRDEAGNTVTAYGTRQFFAKKSSDVYDNPIEIPAPEEDADKDSII